MSVTGKNALHGNVNPPWLRFTYVSANVCVSVRVLEIGEGLYLNGNALA